MILANTIRNWTHFSQGCSSSIPHLLYTGTDEHGQKVWNASIANKTPIDEWTDRLSSRFESLAKRLDIRPDHFQRTTALHHKNTVKMIWMRLKADGWIYKGHRSGWYCESDECWYGAHEVDVHRKISNESGKSVEWASEENWMFRLSALKAKLQSIIPSIVHPPCRVNDTLQWLQSDQFEDISISRRKEKAKWGIEVPDDDQQLIYVWFDALLSYHSSALCQIPGKNSANDNNDLFHLPPFTHVIGKDIVKFHAVYLIALLMAAKLPLPRQIIAHGHLTVNARKISKSSGPQIDPFQLIDRFGTSSIIFYLLKSSKLDGDLDFSYKDLSDCTNSLLVNQFGNLFSRCFNEKIIEKLCSLEGLHKSTEAQSYAVSEKLRQDVARIVKIAKREFDAFRFGVGIDCMMQILYLANKTFTDFRPWILKQGDQHIKECLGHVAYCLIMFSGIMRVIVRRECEWTLNYFGLKDPKFEELLDLKRINLPTMAPASKTHIFPRILLNQEQ